MRIHGSNWLLATIWALTCTFAEAETVVIEARQYLDVVHGKMVSPAVIVVEGDRIAAINPSVRPGNARTVNLGQYTVLPGLMDAHTHLNYEIVDGWETEPVRFTTGDFALRGVPNAAKTLLAGFTTVRDLGTGYGFSGVSLQRAIQEGWVIGPRIIPAGHAVSITGGPCDITGFAPGIVPPEFVSDVADGVVILAGPFADGSGSLVILNAESAKAARAIFRNDPWAQQNILVAADVKEWPIFLDAHDRASK